MFDLLKILMIGLPVCVVMAWVFRPMMMKDEDE